MGAKSNILSSYVLFSVYSNSLGGRGGGVVNPPPPFLSLPSNAASAAYYVFVAKHNGKEEIF